MFAASSSHTRAGASFDIDEIKCIVGATYLNVFGDPSIALACWEQIPTEDLGVRTVYEQPKFEKLRSSNPRPRSTLLRMKNLKA